MNTLDDLRQALATHAPDGDDGLAARPTEVAHRVRTVRRRRHAVAALAALAVVGGGALAVALLGRDAGPGPADDPAPTVTDGSVDPTRGADVTFPAVVEGEPLVSSVVGEPGERAITRGLVLPADATFTVHCTTTEPVPGDRRMPWVTVELDGWHVFQVSCTSGPEPEDTFGAYSFNPEGGGDRPGILVSRTRPDGTERDRYVAPGRNVELTVRLTDADGRRYTRDVGEVRLGIGVYGTR
ncbi:hypothetical protein [Nocardioides sp. J54]|uniref:hypothetical protein n=1 Tax=Nocardioides sp. J54 TaxID=935866 RepID=UPI00048E78E5|nr:hypothetical protein [Nocardioides sp. J54]